MYALKALGRVDAYILQALAAHASKRVRDADMSVAGASAVVCEELDKVIHLLYVFPGGSAQTDYSNINLTISRRYTYTSPFFTTLRLPLHLWLI